MEDAWTIRTDHRGVFLVATTKRIRLADAIPPGFEKYKKTHPEFFPEDQPLEKQIKYFIAIEARSRLQKGDAESRGKKQIRDLDRAVEMKGKGEAVKNDPVLAWSLIPLKDLESYTPAESYSLMDRLRDDLGIKSPKGFDLLPLPELKEWLREQITSEKVHTRHDDFIKKEQEKQRIERRKINVTNLRLRDVTECALIALLNDNNPPQIFVRSGGLVRIINDEKETPSIEICNPIILKHILERSADFSRLRGDGSEKDISPPLEVVQDVLAIRDWSAFPPIEGIIESPVILPDGTITAERGYYPDLRMQYIPTADLHLPDIPEEPTVEDVTDSVKLIKEVFEDFPFCDEASRTNTIAALITAVLSPVIRGFVPLALIDKPQPGIGASLMTDVIAVVATGRPPAKMTAPTEEGEWRKLITARLSQGQGLIIIDNIDKRLVSGSLASVLTSETWNDRVLGQSATITLANHTVFIANGINVETGPDIARRVYWIRIDAQLARPDQRTDFHHPELLEWVKEERGRILAAILTIARSWIRAGSPSPVGIPQMGSFEKWRWMVGGVLCHAGFTEYLGNLEQFRERSDTLSSQWDSFLHVLKDSFPDSFTVKDVKARLDAYGDDKQTSFNDPGVRLCDVIPDDIPLKDRDPSRAIGKAFLRRADHVFPSGVVLRKSGGKVHQAVAWKVEKSG